MKAPFGVSVVVPVFNNADVLPSTISCLMDFFSAEFDRYELIFVDDGSRDNSRRLLEEAVLRHKNIRAIYHHENQGQQRSIADGALAAAEEVILSIDADLPCILSDLKKMAFIAAQGTDLVLGRRMGGPRRIWWRRMGSFCASVLLRIMYSFKVRDFGCSTCAVRRDFVDRLRNKSHELRVLKIQLLQYSRNYIEIDINLPESMPERESGYSLLRLFHLVLSVVRFRITKR